MWEKIKNSLPLNILFICLAAAVSVGAMRITRETMTLSSEARRGEEKIAALAAEKSQLEARIAELETPEAIEREAKEKLNLKKRGETVVVVVPENHDQSNPMRAGFWGTTVSFFLEMIARVAWLFGDR
ncbi:MAG: septum formation initiator family protein [Candidatus Sungbacteria bacterium]|nr:septum formation initiator family protein [Candidatus Sungbacteria bacterium]